MLLVMRYPQHWLFITIAFNKQFLSDYIILNIKWVMFNK